MTARQLILVLGLVIGLAGVAYVAHTAEGGGDKMTIVIQEILQDKITLDTSGALVIRGGGDAVRQAMLGDVSGDLGGD